MSKHENSICRLVISISIPLTVGFLSSMLIKNSTFIYQNLVKPSFAPPSWIFAPVWTVLYILMGIAAYRVWTSNVSQEKKDNALLFYIIQLSLNFLWPIVFFRFDMIFVSFIIIVLLLITIVITTIKFYKIDKVAGYLMIPYILWVSFATILDLSIWLLN